MSDDLQPLSELLERRLGVSVRSGRLGSLADAVRRAAGPEATERLMQRIRHPDGGAPLLDRIVDEMTIRETYFFRELEPLREIDWPAALDGARREGSDVVRVWCAACASGEEAYSLALLSAEAFGVASPPVRVVATDISATALAQARGARYMARAVRHVPTPLRDRWFDRDGDDLVVRRPLRDVVRFERHSLATDLAPRPGRFDLVLCRNVLMYLEPWAVQRAHDTLVSAVAPSGRLLLGTVDRLSLGHTVPQAPAPRPPRAAGRSVRLRGAAPAPEPRFPARAPAPAPPPAAAPGATDDALQAASQMADEGRLAEALALVQDATAAAPMHAPGRFLEGTLLLATGRAREAVTALRAALYADGTFALAAFQLARALDQLGDPAAPAAYQRALAAMDAAGEAEEDLLGAAGLRDLMRLCAAKAVGGAVGDGSRGHSASTAALGRSAG